jgi:hypothetical protein
MGFETKTLAKSNSIIAPPAAFVMTVTLFFNLSDFYTLASGLDLMMIFFDAYPGPTAQMQ